MVTDSKMFYDKKNNDLQQNNYVYNIVNLKNMTDYLVRDIEKKMWHKFKGYELKIHNKKKNHLKILTNHITQISLLVQYKLMNYSVDCDI